MSVGLSLHRALRLQPRVNVHLHLSKLVVKSLPVLSQHVKPVHRLRKVQT
jgi:hypothetical protein